MLYLPGFPLMSSSIRTPSYQTRPQVPSTLTPPRVLRSALPSNNSVKVNLIFQTKQGLGDQVGLKSVWKAGGKSL